MRGMINEWIAWMKCALNAGWQNLHLEVSVRLQQAASQIVITTSTLSLSQWANIQRTYASFVPCLARLSLTIHRVRVQSSVSLPQDALFTFLALSMDSVRRITSVWLAAAKISTICRKTTEKLMERVLVLYSSKPKGRRVANNTW